MIAPNDPLAQCGARVVCFFYACKVLDLAIIKANMPPTRLESGYGSTTRKEPAKVETMMDHLVYAWLLLADMRYYSFDIAAVQKGRQEPVGRLRSIAEPATVTLILAPIAFLLQIPELLCLSLLMFLQANLEGLHTLLHPRCHHALFYKPLSASTMSVFWTTHWHACANPWLQSLAYQPGKRYVGRWFGVLATFSLSGNWHGWASAALVDDDHAVLLGTQVWMFFVILGVICLGERLIWGKKQGGVLQKIVVWSLALMAAGQCFRTLQRHSKIDLLRKPGS